MKVFGLNRWIRKRINKKNNSGYRPQYVKQRHEYVEGEDLPAGRALLRFGILLLLVTGVIYLTAISVNILILGTDDVDYSKHTDTIMLMHWKPLPRRLALLSVPRDTLIRLPKRGIMKINAVYAYGTAIGNRDYALAMTRATVENLLGIKINYTIHVKYSSFIKLVDAMGGVPLYVAQKMRYVDNAGGVNIDLEAGYQLLDGRQSLDYVRFRNDREGDIGRIRRQQAFVKAFLNQLARFSRLPGTMAAFGTFVRDIETNLTVPAALFLAFEIKTVAGTSWRQAILPGEGVYIKGISYWQTDPDEVRKVVADLGNPPKQITKEKKTEVMPAVEVSERIETEGKKDPIMPAFTPEISQPKRNKYPLPSGPQPIVRVLNGCGVNGVAGQIADIIRSGKILIKDADITNAPSFDFSLTIIKSNPVNMPWARSMAEVLQLEELRIQEVPRNIAYPTVTIVIGNDYKEILNR